MCCLTVGSLRTSLYFSRRTPCASLTRDLCLLKAAAISSARDWLDRGREPTIAAAASRTMTKAEVRISNSPFLYEDTPFEHLVACGVPDRTARSLCATRQPNYLDIQILWLSRKKPAPRPTSPCACARSTPVWICSITRSRNHLGSAGPTCEPWSSSPGWGRHPAGKIGRAAGRERG